MANSCAHNHKSSVHSHHAHSHSHSHSHKCSHDHAHSHHSIPSVVSRTITPPPSQKIKKQITTFTPMKCAVLAAAAGTITFLFFYMHNRGSASYRSYQVPLDGTSTNPITSQPLTFQTTSIATAMLVESLFFIRQALNNVRLADFISLAQNSPSVAARYAKDWQGAISHLASSFVCTKNNGKTTDQQDKIGLYAAHKIAPDHDREDLIDQALACRNLSPIDQEQFRKNAHEYLQNLDAYQKVAKMLHNNDPISARVIASLMPIDPKNHQKSQGLQQAANDRIDESYFIFVRRKDALTLFSSSLDTSLKNQKYFQDGKLSPDITILLIEELIKFREAAYTYTPTNHKMGLPSFWDEQLEKILQASSFTPELTIKCYALISSHGHRFTPWLSSLLQKTSITEDILIKLKPSTAIDIDIQQQHKILSIQSYLKNQGVNKTNFDFILKQIDQLIKLNGPIEAIQDLIQVLVTSYKEGSPFLLSTLYIPPGDISKKCLELVDTEFSKAEINVTDVLLPFPTTTIGQWLSRTLEREINIELYKGQVPPDTVTKFLSKVIDHKKGEAWDLRLPYIKKLMAAANDPNEAQLQNWITALLPIEVNDAVDLIVMQNIFVRLLEKIPSLTDQTAEKILASKWSDFLVGHLAEKELGISLYSSKTPVKDKLKVFIEKIKVINAPSSFYLQKIISSVQKAEALDVALATLSHYKNVNVAQEPTKKVLETLLKKMENISEQALEKLLNLGVFKELLLTSYLKNAPLTFQRFDVAMKHLSSMTSLSKIPVIDELARAYYNVPLSKGRFLNFGYNIQGYDAESLDLLEDALRKTARSPEAELLSKLRKDLSRAKKGNTV